MLNMTAVVRPGSSLVIFSIYEYYERLLSNNLIIPWDYFIDCGFTSLEQSIQGNGNEFASLVLFGDFLQSLDGLRT